MKIPDQGLSPVLPDRIGNLDILRAVAALAVCFFHFRRDSMMAGSLYEAVASLGYYGVDVFFVISGYVIPLALSKKAFGFAQIGKFWLARFLRLYPAYILASIFAFSLWHLSAGLPGFQGLLPPAPQLPQILSNLILTADFTREDWFLGVAWSLAIEAQYYILIALAYPLIASKRPRICVLSMLVWGFSPLFIEKAQWVFHWNALFAMGLLCMLVQSGRMGRLWLWFFLPFCLVVQWWARGGISAGVGLVTALFILFAPPLKIPSLVWVGGISYSLYLLHVPVGGRVMNYLERYGDVSGIVLLSVPLALAASLAAAFLFFKTVEAPSHAWARRFGKR